MSLSSHLTELKKKHEHLSMEIEHAQRSPATDGLRIASMKKQKLKLKEEIGRLSTEEYAV
ncbi:YdcH family protein [Phaeobacter sp. C3_T13_0]|uniref:YdcH family protein n=1 Tax=Phaeobacter cretensis TaxID=3342641 RepID=UPI0039BD498F